MIEVQNLTRVFRTYKKQPGFWGGVKGIFRREFEETAAAKDISFSIREGEFVGFLGPNGAGKTTTMKMIYGAVIPTGGELTVAGLDVYHHEREIKRRIGVVPQENNLDDELKVRENLLKYGRY